MSLLNGKKLSSSATGTAFQAQQLKLARKLLALT